MKIKCISPEKLQSYKMETTTFGILNNRRNANEWLTCLHSLIVCNVKWDIVPIVECNTLICTRVC